MAGYMTAEVWCDGDGCNVWVMAPNATRLADLRRGLRTQGWRRRWRDGSLIDLCPRCADEGAE